MFSMWEKVSGAIMEGPTLGSPARVASGKSGHKKAVLAGRLGANRCCPQAKAPANHFW